MKLRTFQTFERCDRRTISVALINATAQKETCQLSKVNLDRCTVPICLISLILSPVTRTPVEYTERFERFVQKSKDYSKQYNGVYLTRLKLMRQLLRY
jgi:hypothetical protein